MELVAQIRMQGVIVSKLSLGWQILKPFQHLKSLNDLHLQNNNPNMRDIKNQTINILQGSPGYLLTKSNTENLPSHSMTITYSNYTFKVNVFNIHLFLCQKYCTSFFVLQREIN